MFNYRDYYNYFNNNYNKPNYDQNNELLNDFDPYEGFIRGNLFKDLFNSYRNEMPVQIVPQNEQAEILTSLDALEFAMNDLQLFLDVHPDSKEAFDKFNKYRQNYNEYLYEYQKKFGPIVINSDALLKYPYSWINSPWPWEVEK